MATQLEIINLALSRGGVARIDSLDEASKSGRTARLAWDTAKDSILRAHNWGFAYRRVRLSKLADKPLGRTYAYAVPDDYIVIRRILFGTEAGQDGAGAPFEIRNINGRTAVVCDIKNAIADYTARVDTCELFDEIFTDALAWRLASDFAMSLKSDVEIANAAYSMSERLTARAAMANARENHQDDEEISSFERARWN